MFICILELSLVLIGRLGKFFSAAGDDSCIIPKRVVAGWAGIGGPQALRPKIFSSTDSDESGTPRTPDVPMNFPTFAN